MQLDIHSISSFGLGGAGVLRPHMHGVSRALRGCFTVRNGTSCTLGFWNSGALLLFWFTCMYTLGQAALGHIRKGNGNRLHLRKARRGEARCCNCTATQTYTNPHIKYPTKEAQSVRGAF